MNTLDELNCINCNTPLTGTQKRFCSDFCREAYTDAFGTLEIPKKDQATYDFSDYDPEDEKYGGL